MRRNEPRKRRRATTEKVTPDAAPKKKSGARPRRKLLVARLVTLKCLREKRAASLANAIRGKSNSRESWSRSHSRVNTRRAAPLGIWRWKLFFREAQLTAERSAFNKGWAPKLTGKEFSLALNFCARAINKRRLCISSVILNRRLAE